MLRILPSALVSGALFMLAPFTTSVAGESGPYIGGSVGSATIQANIEDPSLPDPPPKFDENDFGWKIYGGYNFAFSSLFSLGLEAGYTDLGNPSTTLATVPIDINPTMWNIYGTAGLDFGPIGVFAKYGVAMWDADVAIDNFSFSDDGSDPAYGVGVKFNLGSLEIRGEYEIYDISDTDDVTLFSAGLVYHF